MNMGQSGSVSGLLRQSPARVFLVGVDTDRKGRKTATVHSAKEAVSRRDLDRLRNDLLATGEVSRVSLRRHSSRKLLRGRSLEAFLASMSHDEILLDATGAFERGQLLTAFAREMRHQFGEKLDGIYWNSRWRTLYVRLDRAHFVRGETVRVEDLAKAENKAKAALAAIADETFAPAVRLGFELPDAALVPVDEASFPARASTLGVLRTYLRVPAIGMAIGLGTMTGAAADDAGPAVSALNGKLAIIGGYSDDDNRDSETEGVVAGSLATPLSHSFGFQADGAAGAVDGDFITGVGGHLFWRDPSQAMVGVIASYARRDVSGGSDLEASRVGGETEIYLDQFTLAARAGQQFGGSNVDDGFFGRADVSWYATDDFRLRLGVANDPIIDTTVGADVEFQPGYGAVPGLSFFADTSFGDDSYVRASIGVRFYFGDPAKSLKRRHREDDPEDNLGLEGLNSVTNVNQPADTPYVSPYIY